MTAPERKPSFVTTGFLVAVWAVLWLGLWGQLLVLTQLAKRRYDEFGLQLPALTKQILKLSLWLQSYGWLWVVAALAGTVVFGGALGWLRHSRWTRTASWVAVLVIAGLFTANLFVSGSLLLPEIKLQEGLRK